MEDGMRESVIVKRVDYLKGSGISVGWRTASRKNKNKKGRIGPNKQKNEFWELVRVAKCL